MTTPKVQNTTVDKFRKDDTPKLSKKTKGHKALAKKNSTITFQMMNQKQQLTETTVVVL